MTLRTLYHLALDPACREVQLVLAEKRLDYRLAQLSGAAEPIEVPQLGGKRRNWRDRTLRLGYW